MHVLNEYEFPAIYVNMSAYPEERMSLEILKILIFFFNISDCVLSFIVSNQYVV